MSTLKVTNIQATGETASRAVSGVAAAWVNANSSFVVQDSYGISSITDNATGQLSLNFSSSMANASYSVSGSGKGSNSFANYNRVIGTDGGTTSLANLLITDLNTPSFSDREFSASIHGDLA